MSAIAGVDVGNATTEVVLVADGTIVASGRVPTRGRKGSADSLKAAAALVRRLERQAGRTVAEARIAPLRAVGTSLVTVPGIAAATGRLRVLAADVPTPGVAGVCIGRPLMLTSVTTPGGTAGSFAADPVSFPAVALVPHGVGYEQAARLLRELIAVGVRIGAVLVAADEGVLIANRVPAAGAVIDQVDIAAAGACELLAVEVSPPGRPLRLLTDAMALGAGLGLDAGETTSVSRMLTDYSNAVVGLGPNGDGRASAPPDEPWVRTADGERHALRTVAEQLAEWPPGTVRAFGPGNGNDVEGTSVSDLFAVDLGAAAEAADELAGLLGIPVRSPVTEAAASRLGALTTPGASDEATVIDLGAGTIDVIAIDEDVVAAGAGELLTAAVAQALGIPRAAADWVKRGPCVRVDGGHRYEAEDGTRGFLDAPAPASAAGMLAVHGPGGLLPFDRRHNAAEWRAKRVRIKSAVLIKNLERAMRKLTTDPSQILVVGGPAGDEELLGLLARALPDGVAVGRGNTGGALGPRYAAAFGLALAD